LIEIFDVHESETVSPASDAPCIRGIQPRRQSADPRDWRSLAARSISTVQRLLVQRLTRPSPRRPRVHRIGLCTTHPNPPGHRPHALPPFAPARGLDPALPTSSRGPAPRPRHRPAHRHLQRCPLPRDPPRTSTAPPGTPPDVSAPTHIRQDGEKGVACAPLSSNECVGRTAR
jgi:hypothetical protein